MTIAICTPTAGSLKATYVASLLNLIHCSSLTKALNYDLTTGSMISASREFMVESALAIDASHVLFIDDDHGFESDCLDLALSQAQPIVIANYRQKLPPWCFTARTLDGRELVTTAESTGLEQALYGGFGFALIAIEVFKALPKPRFLAIWNERDQGYTTEDVPFFEQALGEGFTCYVDHDLSKKVWHVGEYNYHWSAVPVASAVDPQLENP